MSCSGGISLSPCIKHLFRKNLKFDPLHYGHCEVGALNLSTPIANYKVMNHTVKTKTCSAAADQIDKVKSFKRLLAHQAMNIKISTSNKLRDVLLLNRSVKDWAI